MIELCKQSQEVFPAALIMKLNFTGCVRKGKTCSLFSLYFSPFTFTVTLNVARSAAAKRSLNSHQTLPRRHGLSESSMPLLEFTENNTSRRSYTCASTQAQKHTDTNRPSHTSNTVRLLSAPAWANLHLITMSCHMCNPSIEKNKYLRNYTVCCFMHACKAVLLSSVKPNSSHFIMETGRNDLKFLSKRSVSTKREFFRKILQLRDSRSPPKQPSHRKRIEKVL